MPNKLKLFTGNANPALAQEIAEYLDISLGNAKVARFADGEIKLEINESVRGMDVFIVQPTCAPVNDNLMELLIMIDAMKNDFEKRFQDPEGKHMHLEIAYTKDLDAALQFKAEVQEAFPGCEIVMNPLSLSVSCHIGPGALAIACSKEI